MRIVIAGHHVATIVDPPAVLRPHMEYRHRVHTTGGPTGVVETVETLSLCAWRDDSILFSAGMVPRVVEHLESVGYRVEVDDRRVAVGGCRAYADADLDVKPRRQRMLQAVASHYEGQVEVANMKDAVENAALICHLFRRAKTLVIVRNKKVARWLRSELWRRLSEPVGLFISDAPEEKHRCIVTTATGMPPRGKWDVVLLMDVEMATGAEFAAQITSRTVSLGRIYGFVIAGKRLDHFTLIRAEMIAGPVIHHASPPRIPVYASMLPAPHCNVLRATTPLGQKRTLYARNAKRNRYVAGLATQVAADPAAAIGAWMSVPRLLAKLLKRSRIKVAILTESAAHLRRLAGLLPTWRLCVGQSKSPYGLPMNANAEHSIITVRHAAAFGIDANIVIRADGTSSRLAAKHFPPRADQDKRPCVLVLDLADTFHSAAAEHAERRLSDYARVRFRILTCEYVPFAKTLESIPTNVDFNVCAAGESHACGISSQGSAPAPSRSPGETQIALETSSAVAHSPTELILSALSLSREMRHGPAHGHPSVTNT